MAFIPMTEDQIVALGETDFGKTVERDPKTKRHLATNADIGTSQDNLDTENYYGHPVED
jgi:hypothetical protein